MNIGKQYPIVATLDDKIFCADKTKETIEIYVIKEDKWTFLSQTIHAEPIQQMVIDNGQFYVLNGQFIEKFLYPNHCWLTVIIMFLFNSTKYEN